MLKTLAPLALLVLGLTSCSNGSGTVTVPSPSNGSSNPPAPLPGDGGALQPGGNDASPSSTTGGASGGNVATGAGNGGSTGVGGGVAGGGSSAPAGSSGGPAGGGNPGGASPVPEPGTILLVGTGLAGAALLRRRRVDGPIEEDA